MRPAARNRLNSHSVYSDNLGQQLPEAGSLSSVYRRFARTDDLANAPGYQNARIPRGLHFDLEGPS